MSFKNVSHQRQLKLWIQFQKLKDQNCGFKNRGPKSKN